VLDDLPGDPWSYLGRRFVDGHYSTLRGRVRTHVVHQHLLAHLPSADSARIVDVGGGAGHQSIPLARAGHHVTIVEPSPWMIGRARDEVRAAGVDSRVDFVEVAGERALDVLEAESFDAVLCHGVVMYLDDPEPLIDALAGLVAPAGIVSIVAKNVEVMAVRPALSGDWAAALAAFDQDREVNGLGADTRGDRVDGLAAALQARGVEPEAWYGVRLFTDGWVPERPATDPEDLVLAVELEASRRDPYRGLSRLFHLVARKR
jgi:S-adenosylmethionine-dependent methyltransferase